jgi:2'-5' RNA ligase
VRTIGVAIAIPEPYGEELQRRRVELGDPLAVGIPTHVTILPPTEVDEAALDEIDEHLRLTAESFQPFTMHLRGSATFRPISPVVFIGLAQGIAECDLLESMVRTGPLKRDLFFNYHPHVTIAHDVPDDVLDRAFAEFAAYEARFSVWGFSLYEHGADRIWRPQRDFVFGRPLPGPAHPHEE